LDLRSPLPRVARVEELVRRELADIFLRSVKDPRLQQCVVSRVAMSRDLRVARVWLSAYGQDEEEIHSALSKASGYLRREVARRLDLRNSPELRFEMDRGPRQLMEMSELLRGLDTGATEEADAPADREASDL
jgi:ribosome-binding factor A